MIVEILTPEQVLYTGKQVLSVQLSGIKGKFQILKNHAPLISQLDKGIVKIQEQNSTLDFSISGGFVECIDNKVIVLVEGGEKITA